jgi:DNA-binding MarR family transcriptional regulator
MKTQADHQTSVPGPGEGKRGEQGYLGYLLRQASNAVRLGIDRSLEDLGVTQPQFLVMTMINAYPGVSGAEVARLTMLTPQTISLIVSNLERDGRLHRAVSPDHGRVQQMELTEEGQSLLARCRKRTSRLDVRLHHGLTPEQEQFLRGWLVDIATRDLLVQEDDLDDD